MSRGRKKERKRDKRQESIEALWIEWQRLSESENEVRRHSEEGKKAKTVRKVDKETKRMDLKTKRKRKRRQ